jgi:hypothetical protein
MAAKSTGALTFVLALMLVVGCGAVQKLATDDTLARIQSSTDCEWLVKTLFAEAIETDKREDAEGDWEEMEWGMHQTRYLAASQRVEELQCPLSGSSSAASGRSSSSTSVPNSTTSTQLRGSSATTTTLRSSATSTIVASPTTTVRPTTGTGIDQFLPSGTLLIRGPMTSTFWGYPEEIYVFWSPRMTNRGLYDWFKQSGLYGSALNQYNWCKALPGVVSSGEHLWIVDSSGFSLAWKLKGDPTSGLGIDVPSRYFSEKNGYEGGVKGLHFTVTKYTDGGEVAGFCK